MSAAETSRRGPIGVIGLWHLGSVTAACLAAAGREVVGVDPDPAVAAELAAGRPPVAEPGLADLIGEHADRLRFASDAYALAGVGIAWVTFDTPVDDEDNADVDWVLATATQMLTPLARRALVVVSSQLPVGSVAALRARCAAERGEDDLRFACVPENLRLGDALRSFRAPDRIVAGVSSNEDRHDLQELLGAFSDEILWMRVESAEVTKHALNGFLATSVAFINEIAAICEVVGADAAEVARGLKSEPRIGPRAYLAPGDAFAGGTLARDIGFLRELAERHGVPADVFAGVASGNAAHRAWARRMLCELLAEGDERALRGATVALWGLTYKPGTDTLRRSSAVELGRWLTERGVVVRAHDPSIAPPGPAELPREIVLCDSAMGALEGADALVVSTAWPQYRQLSADAACAALKGSLVIDAGGFLADTLGSLAQLRYVRVGSPLPGRREPYDAGSERQKGRTWATR
jgi:UDPglucose 6-dehydrogenase